MPSFSAQLRIYYDEGFANKFGTEAGNAVRRIMAHAQNIWMWSASLGTKVIFDIVKVEPKPGFWVTNDFLLWVFSVFHFLDVFTHINEILIIEALQWYKDF